MRAKWLWGLVFALAPAAASAGDLGKGDLIGTWAVDCSQPPSGGNIFEYFSLLPDGTVRYQPVISENRGLLPSQTLSNFTPLGGGLLRAKFVRDTDGDITLVTISIADKHLWSQRSVDPDGTLHVEGGNFVGDGQPVPHLAKCG